jgi:hypothetical protein
MRVAPEIVLTEAEHAELAKLVRSKLTSVRLAQRARIVLLAAEGMQNKAIAQQLGVGRVQVARWRERSGNAEGQGAAPDRRQLRYPQASRRAGMVAKHPRFHMHFTPTSASWLNMVERFFRDITTERMRRGVFTSVPALVTAIDDYIAHHNTKPKPFIWTKSARDILQKVIRANSRLSSKQNATLH